MTDIRIPNNLRERFYMTLASAFLVGCVCGWIFSILVPAIK